MTYKKPKDKHVKPGPKSAAKRKEIDKKLKELYFKGGITYTQAAIDADCGAEYASLQFKKFAEQITEYEDTDWLENEANERTRALEGISKMIQEREETLERHEKRLKKMLEIHNAILPNLVQKVEDSKVGRVLANMDMDDVLEVYKIISKDLDMYKNYGYHIDGIESTIRQESIFKAELQMEYSAIKMKPPIKERMIAELEKRIAEKNNLQPKEEVSRK
jgi:archaellum component FlaC